MADSIEQRLIEKVVERMQGILTTNTYTDFGGNTVHYATNIGRTVEDSRPNWDQEDDLADGAISVFQGAVQPDLTQSDDEQIFVVRKLPVLIKVFLPRGATPATGAALARTVTKDIYAAIKTDMLWNDSGTPLARRTSEKSHAVEYTEASFEITGVNIEIEIEYLTHYFTMD